MEWSVDASSARRRMQNRLAQRRFRWKQTRNRRSTNPRSTTDDLASPQLMVQDQEPGVSPSPARPGASDISGTEYLNYLRIASQSGTTVSDPREEFALSAFAESDFCTLLPGQSELTYSWLSGDGDDDAEGVDPPLVAQPEQIGLEASENSIVSTLWETPTPNAFPNTSSASTRTSSQIFPPTPESASTTSAYDQTPLGTCYRSAAPYAQIVQDSNTAWFNPLHSAAARGHARIVRVLLEHQMGTSDRCNARDSDGLTPLAHAIAGGFEDVVSCLLAHGAYITDVAPGPKGGVSALHWAVLKRREACLQRLLEHKDVKADTLNLVNDVDGVGRSPLHLAVQIDFEAGVALLLKHGADLDSKAPKR
ncbi:hypothetical protein ANO14919_073020 [Xylariales sp. No.14919]|nr:hypothetical protein ANO14919_073020 [Xylariales sp. No.14919]